jgi:hypothetical protein
LAEQAIASRQNLGEDRNQAANKGSSAMSRMQMSLLGTSAFFAVLATVASASSLTLHVSTGLWEIVSKVKMSGMENKMGVSPSQMADMPPASRARLQAAMAAVNGVHTNTVKSCVTQKDLDRPFHPGGMNEPGVTCNETVLSATSTDESIRVACSGRRTMDGTFHFTAPTPGTMNGHMDMTVTDHGHVMNMTSELQGRWLGASCGAIKPSDD